MPKDNFLWDPGLDVTEGGLGEDFLEKILFWDFFIGDRRPYSNFGIFYFWSFLSFNVCSYFDDFIDCLEEFEILDEVDLPDLIDLAGVPVLNKSEV